MAALNDLTLHHIGVATRGIERERPIFEALGYTSVSGIHGEPSQGVRGMFMAAPGMPTLELLENAGPRGPLDAALARGVKLYHFAYAVPNVEQCLGRLCASLRAKVVVPPGESTYFRQICFLMLPNMLLIELVEEHDSKVSETMGLTDGPGASPGSRPGGKG